MLKRFLAYYKPYKALFTLDMLASLLVAMIGIGYPILTRTMLNDLIPNRNYRMIVVCGGSLLLIYVLRMLLNYFIQYYGHMIGVRMQAQMRSDMFAHLERLPYSFFDRHETGKIMSRMTNDLMDISELAHHGPENVLISLISVITAFLYLYSIHPTLTFIIFACVPFLVLVAALVQKKMTAAFMESRVSIAQINASLESSISGIRVTKAFSNAAKEQEKFEQGNKNFISARRNAYRAMGQFHSSTTFITDVFNVVILIAGGLFLYQGQIQVGDYSSFVVSVNLFISPIMKMIDFMELYQNGVTGFSRFTEILDAAPETDLPDAVDVDRLQGHIELRGVTYSYERQSDDAITADEHHVLEDINLDIEQGKTYALVGPSGGGKTTICHLIPRFYPLSQGSILIDGMDIRHMSMESLRRNIGIVQQDIYLFNASIRDNILYGRLDATKEEVEDAAKRANIHDYILSLEDGYDTIIGERGVRLSGGQKQRLSIARVFLKNPPILILDEATSALDNTTEILIQQALDELCRGRTTLVVAHRLSTIKNAHRIAVISNGHIVENGTHAELLAQQGVYASLYRLQFRESDVL